MVNIHYQNKTNIYIILLFLFIHINCQQIRNLEKDLEESQTTFEQSNMLNSQQQKYFHPAPLRYTIISQNKSNQSKLHVKLKNKIGETYTQEFRKMLQSIPVIKLHDIPRKQLTRISKGFSSRVFLWKTRDLIVKAYRKGKVPVIRRQLRNLVIVNQIYPNFLKYVIVINQRIVGLVLQRAMGRSAKMLKKQTVNVFHTNITAKLNLIQLIKLEVRKMQQFNLAHADIFPKNIMVNQHGKQNPNVTVKFIDFGNSFVFSYDKLVNARIMYDVAPPQYNPNRRYYNGTGLNAYQFGMCSLMILLDRDIAKPLQFQITRQRAFKKLIAQGLTQNQAKYFEALFHKNIDIRNAALFSQPDAFVQKYSSKLIKRKKKNDTQQNGQTKQQDKQQNCFQLFNQQ